MTTNVVHVTSGDTLPVELVLGFDAVTDVPTVVHRVIGSGVPDFTVQAPAPRTGTYRFLAADAPAGDALAALLTRPGILAVTGAEIAAGDATFYVTGAVSWALDPDTLTRVIVSADWTETG